MDAVVQSGDRGFLIQDGLDDFSFDAFEWLREGSFFEDYQPTPAAWPFDAGGAGHLNAAQKQRVEPNARATEPATYNHLKFQTTSSTITASSLNTASSHYLATSHVCDDNVASFGGPACSNIASPQLSFQSISHSSTGPALQAQYSIHARNDRPSQTPTQFPASIEPTFEQYQISQVHVYPTPSSPSIVTPIVTSPLNELSIQEESASFKVPTQPSQANFVQNNQFTFGSESMQLPYTFPTTPSTTYSSPTKKPSSLPNVFENAVFSSQEVTPTLTEVRSLSLSAATSSTGVLQKAQAVPKSKRKRDDYNLENTCSEVAFKDKSGAVAAYSQVFGTARNLRQAYSEGQRKEIARTRRLGACERCKKFKMKCHRPDSPYELCLRCVMSSPQVLNMPCFLAKPVDAELFRDKPSIMHPLQTPRSEVYRLLDIEAPQHHYLKLQLTQDLGETLDVYVVQYEPRPNEKTSHPWKDRSGKSRALDMPPFCIANMSDVRGSMLEYINAFRGAFLSKLRMSCNEITGKIIDEARRYAAFNPNSTVRKAIDLFAATRIIENDWRICGERTLGINVVEDEENPWFGKIPVTPIMDTQLDQIVIQGFLKPLRDQLLQELQTKIYESRRENWFEIFLTTSILLTNAELLLSHSRKNAKRYGANRRYNSLERAYKYFHTCNLLIAHFHFVCVGFAPLKLDWTSPNASTMAVLDLDQMAFMTQLQGMIRKKEEHVLSLRAKREYEEELYWCHQLFFEKWEWEKPRIEDRVDED